MNYGNFTSTNKKLKNYLIYGIEKKHSLKSLNQCWMKCGHLWALAEHRSKGGQSQLIQRGIILVKPSGWKYTSKIASARLWVGLVGCAECTHWERVGRRRRRGFDLPLRRGRSLRGRGGLEGCSGKCRLWTGWPGEWSPLCGRRTTDLSRTTTTTTSTTTTRTKTTQAIRNTALGSAVKVCPGEENQFHSTGWWMDKARS